MNVDGEGRAIISEQGDRLQGPQPAPRPLGAGLRLQRRLFGQWLFIEGNAKALSLPEAMDPLIDYYKRFPDENPDWDDYRARMERERRVLIRIELERAGPPSGLNHQSPPGALRISSSPAWGRCSLRACRRADAPSSRSQGA